MPIAFNILSIILSDHGHIQVEECSDTIQTNISSRPIKCTYKSFFFLLSFRNIVSW